MLHGRKIGYMPTGSYQNLAVDQICENLKSIGYDAVEWGMFFASPDTHSLKELKVLVDAPHRFGLEVSEVVVQKDLVLLDEDLRHSNIALIKQCIRAYSEVGINTINLFTGPCPWISNPLVIDQDLPMGKAWDMVFEAFDELVAEAEKYHIQLAVENVWGQLCNDFFTLKYLIDHYHSPYLGVNFDPSHDILVNHRDTGWLIRQWGGAIKHVHLKDAAGIMEKDRFIFPLLGEGLVDWNVFLQAMDAIGYAGIMSVEYESFGYVEKIFKGDWTKAAQNAFDNLNILLDQQ